MTSNGTLAKSLLLLEPYYTGSHAAWLRGYQQHSQHTLQALTLAGQFWQWRMLNGAVTLARQFLAGDFQPDILLASDMLDLPTFLALTRHRTHHLPTVVYFHENQLTYPPNPRIKRKKEIALINYQSALVAERVFFNSEFHRQIFLEALPRLLRHYQDHNELDTVEEIAAKSSVLPIGVDLRRFDPYRVEVQNPVPLILWNHRWEHDKNPKTFFNALHRLFDEGYEFRLALLGENFRQKPEEFEIAHQTFGDWIVQYGYAEDFATYARLMWSADVVVSTAHQDFFGISVVEGMYCGCYPILPHRLNYPAFIPPEFQSAMLFDHNEIYHALKKYLDERPPTPPSLAQNMLLYDWHTIAPHYDRVLGGSSLHSMPK